MKYDPRKFDLAENYIFEGEGDIEPYLFSEDIAIAVDVAFATGRPLLVSGKPGSGKSRLAEAVAALKKWHFLSKTMTSRTRLEELTVELDHLRRLHDAHSGNGGQNGKNSAMKPDWAYHNPGIFWWALNHESAKYRGVGRQAEAETMGLTIDFPGTFRKQENNAHHTVLLIDEIDKAEPDLPNDLLEPLDRKTFGLPDGSKIMAKDGVSILTIITTNGERELPQAFLRRCVSLKLEEPKKRDLIRIARKHYPNADEARITAIAEKMETFRGEAKKSFRRPPSTSEFLDAVRVCEDLEIAIDDSKDSVWKKVENSVLLKKSNDNDQA
ncbi:ATPase [bacterium endosymbiont of Escarpia laminata]|nr:MAG: ATPase [bacterium endosymbiont of Escarpia laminata]